MKRIMDILLYLICFFVLMGIIYYLALSIPPNPESSQYIAYSIFSAAFAFIISAALVSACVLLDRDKKE